MPFVRKTDSQGSQPPTDTRKMFIGRTGELLFFVQNILKPEEPTHNIISIWGQGGVGKSTLLSRFIDEARSTEFKDYCLTALVDERQTTSTSIMEKFADQLHMEGEFGKVLKQYKEALRKLQTEQETLQDAVLSRVPDFAGAAAEMVPFVGPLLREGAKATAGLYLDKRQKVQGHRDVEILEDPLDDLTRAFVDELNRITDTQVSLSSDRVKNRRVILFFDTFEQLAIEATPWLLNYFLPANIKSNIVLVIAGRDQVERSIPDDTKRWLPFCDNETIFWIPLNSFTVDETRTYLIKRNITDPDRIATIWELSQGLPLYLSLLTSNPRGKIDPTADVVANFLRWIPEREHIKRQLALDAALFSKPFNQDDLEAFSYLPENELPSLYHWLIAQPFVRPQDGQYSYHDVARELFSRHLYQRSKKGYFATRRALVNHYERLLEKTQEERGKDAYNSAESLELSLALIDQLLSLPDEASHLKAIEQVLSKYKTMNDGKEIVRILRECSMGYIANPAGASAIQIATNLEHIIEAEREMVITSDRRRIHDNAQKLLAAANYLLEKVVDEPSFPSERLADIYLKRSHAFYSLEDSEKGFEDLKRTIELDPGYALAYAERGVNHRIQGALQQAIKDLDFAVKLDPSSAYAYAQRGITYGELKDYQRAIQDFNHALELSSKAAWIYLNRGRIYRDLKEYGRAFKDFNHVIELNTQDWTCSAAYNHRGKTYHIFGEYELALADFQYVLKHDPGYSSYSGNHGNLGITYLWMKDVKQAKSSYALGWELDPKMTRYGWMVEYVSMCQERPDSRMYERLEMIAATNPEHYTSYVCRGVAMWLRKHYEEALAQLEQAIQVGPAEWMWDSHFWKGMVCASLGWEEKAMEAIEQSLELELPPILLTPLRWFEQDRPDFYQKYVVPLMARYDLV